MKSSLIILLTCVAALLSAQESGSWEGNFSGEILGVTCKVSAQREGVSWTATIDADGYLYNLEGIIDGVKCEGVLSDPQTEGSVPFEGKLSGNDLTITLPNVDPSSGQPTSVDLVFSKTTSSTAQSGSTSTIKPQVSNKNLDQRITGTWRFTDVYVSGQFSFATDYFMQFNADGTMLWTDGRTAGGGPDISMDSGTGDVHSANWKAENNAVWLDAGNGWEYYAKYYQENGNLMFTFNNGKRQVWGKL